MIDPFAKARAMQAMRQQPGMASAQPPASAAPAQPMAQHPVAPMPTQSFAAVAKKLGVGHWKLDPNPTIARTQLLKHMQGKYGPDFMKNPEAKQLLDAFNQGSAAGMDNMDTHQAKSMQSLFGSQQ